MSPLKPILSRTLPGLALLTAMALAACGPTPPAAPAAPVVPPEYQARIDTGPKGEPIHIPAVRPEYLRDRNKRQRVAYNGPDAPGTLVVDPYARFLYHVLENGEAMRFGVSVGDAGRGFSGDATIRRKAAWPYWAPTQNMIRTMPETYASLAGGLPGGLNNPLGARALYLYRGGKDTMYRIHGTMDPASIGKATTAGCIRVFNQDILDIYDEVPMGSQVRVRSRAESLRLEGPLVETPEGFVIPAAEAAAAAQQAPAQPGQPGA
ncbi:L,D-transpeptidase [Paracoccus sp. p4-l81]|uniref:L,D-transpeptidase n=1 Tax=unclassified Paracoccus (in: a-proteobacteria) TaxID=2688777 RepID=UPI0035B7A740